MNHPASNSVRQWAAVHRLKVSPTIAASARSGSGPVSNVSGQFASQPQIVPPESAVVRLMLNVSLFFNRATWFSLWLVLPMLAANVSAADAVFAPPTASDARTQALQWIAERGISDKAVLERVAQEWTLGETPLTTEDIFQRVIRTMTTADADAKKIIDACQEAIPIATWPREVIPQTDAMTNFAKQHLRLYVGRFLAQRQLYEEALEVLIAVDPKQIVDPASYFFQRAICEHQLLKKSDAMRSLGNLLDSTQNVPERYKAVALLMRHDLEQLKEASLGEVAKKMQDVERRLTLGRGGEKTQKVEEEIVEALDEIIKKVEQQQQNSAGGGGGKGGNQNQSGGAAGDSSIKGATAPGEVDQKDIGNKAGWGTLPPKKATEAKNVINRNFPSHYREAIEQYFKKLANRPAGKE
ncbi:MAG: hypothetical protein ACKV2Q_04870 [Planctomycetaceae bacterium]